MDTVQHAAHGWLIAKGIEAATGYDLLPVVEIASACLGALPDISTVLSVASDDWRYYVWAHGDVETAPQWVRWIVLVLRLLPPYGFHVLLDAYTHKVGNRWWMIDEGMHVEVMSATVTICLCYVWTM